MANALPVIEQIYISGATAYVQRRDRLTGKVFNTVSLLFETYNSANWALYAIALTEQVPSGYYTAAAPAATAGFLVSDALFIQAGGSPATSDGPAVNLGYSAGQNVSAIAGDPTIAPTNLQAALATENQGSVQAGVITAQTFPTSLTNATVAAYQGLTIRFITGAAAGMAGLIANYNPAGGIITLSGSLAVAPSAADKFIVV